jgi:ABC-type branched-subunit amino acid transport system substrate-binding protein
VTKGAIVSLKLILISGILLSCTSGEEPANRDQEPIYIAIVAPLSGPLSEFGWSMLRGSRMRIEEAKHESPGHGRPARLIALDDRGKAQQAIRLATNMSSHQSMVGVIGHLTTGCTLSAIPVYDSAPRILISPGATGDDLEHINSPYVFRTILSESQQARSLADSIYRTIDKKEVVLICEDSPLGNRLRSAFMSRSTDIGLGANDILVGSDPFPNLSEAIEKIVPLHAGAIFLAGGPRLAALIVRKWPEKIDRPLIFGTYRLISEEFSELAGRHRRGIVAAHPCVWRSDFKKGRDIKDRYEKRFKYGMDWLAIQAYDALDLVLWAIGKSGMDPDSMSDALQGLNSKKRARPGLAGPIYFNANGSLAREVTVASYTGSGWKLIEEKEVNRRH